MSLLTTDTGKTSKRNTFFDGWNSGQCIKVFANDHENIGKNQYVKFRSFLYFTWTEWIDAVRTSTVSIVDTSINGRNRS